MTMTIEREHAVVEGVPKLLFIGGQWREAAGGRTFPVEDPSTGAVLCEVADARPEDGLAALAAAAEAQDAWALTSPRDGNPVPQSQVQADVRVCWSDAHLFVGAVVKDANPTSPFQRDEVDPRYDEMTPVEQDEEHAHHDTIDRADRRCDQ